MLCVKAWALRLVCASAVALLCFHSDAFLAPSVSTSSAQKTLAGPRNVTHSGRKEGRYEILVRYGFDLIAELERFHDSCMIGEHVWEEHNDTETDIFCPGHAVTPFRVQGVLCRFGTGKGGEKKIEKRRDFSNGISQKVPFINFLYPLSFGGFGWLDEIGPSSNHWYVSGVTPRVPLKAEVQMGGGGGQM